MIVSSIKRVWLALVIVALALSVAGISPLGAQNAHVTQKDVLPILEKNCFQCHGENLRMANLDLRTRDAMLKGGDNGPSLVPGNAEASSLYMRVSRQQQPAMPMAPLPPLSESEMLLLKNWIDEGAIWGETTAGRADTQAPGDKANASYHEYEERVITDEMRQWWAFQKPVRHQAPEINDSRWSSNPIDRFIKAQMDANGLTPAPPADRNTLIRRLYLDLIGLLPSQNEVDAFVNDPSPQAYENLVERLLASPHYGERWGRHWLDVVRYADSSGFEHDRTLASAWRFRDYVIKAFNEDKPYNRFVIEHIAGDELDEPTNDSLTATAFYRIGPRVRFREKDNPFYRYDYLDDMIRTTFGGFMGMSVHCARCHDHKFDPITRMDYYRTLAMFFGYVKYDHPLVPREDAEKWARRTREVAAQLEPLRKRVAEIEAPYRRAEFERNLGKLPEEVQAAIRVPREERTPGQKLLAAQFERNLYSEVEAVPGAMDEDPALGILTRAATDDTTHAYRSPGDKDPAAGERERIKISAEDEKERARLLAKIEELEAQMPAPPPAAEGVRDGDYRLAPDGPGDDPAPGKTYRIAHNDLNPTYLPEPGANYHVPAVHFGANGLVLEADQEAPTVEPGFITVLAKGTERVAVPPNRDGYVSSGRRRALAEWIASPDNPLTARVLVNRLWYWHFGRGIVPTPGNFGKMGMPPSHPHLLDWLATEFVRQDWSIKQMQRLILNSQTYQQASSFYQAGNMEKDPTNVNLWRYPSRRLEGEVIRDIVLSAGGRINLKAGGEPFFPSLPLGVRLGYRQGKWDLTEEGPDTWRRSVYSYWKRGLKFPMFEVLDQPDQNVTAEKRNISTVPTQALSLLNNEFMLIQGQNLADRIRNEAGSVPEAQVKTMYRITLGREPNSKELSTSLEFLDKERNFQAADGVSGSGQRSDRDADLRALTRLAHAMLNFNEFVYIP